MNGWKDECREDKNSWEMPDKLVKTNQSPVSGSINLGSLQLGES